MPPTPDDPPTLAEISRTLSDFRAEFRNQITSLMRTDVYRAEQQAITGRLDRLEADATREETERDSFRRLVYGAFVSAGLSLVVALIMFLVSRH